MPKFAIVLLFIAMTFLSWGVYGPVLHEGQYAMGSAEKPASLRPLICVGIAYFVIAVVVPVIFLKTKGEKGSWSFGGVAWSFAAGAAGAVGAEDSDRGTGAFEIYLRPVSEDLALPDAGSILTSSTHSVPGARTFNSKRMLL